MNDASRHTIRKVLVANRGEIAMRVFQSCRELGIGTVAVYSDADADAPHRFGADESVRIGPPAASESYLRKDALIEAARATGADAIHPGYGFLSENADFAEAVADAGFVFIGPSADNIRDMGDKVCARKLMMAAGVPVVPGTEQPIDDIATLTHEAERIGFPLLVKAAGGGGGKGIRKVDGIEELENGYRRATSEAASAFGDARVYLERYVSPARHIEAQILGDGRGGASFLGERDCSLQRNHQKVVEESPSPAIDAEIRTRLREAALAGTRAIHYSGAGTFEFLYDERTRDFYFLEMNTRLQVEHPVTELVTGVDLVAEQLRIAAGGSLADVEEPPCRGHAIEIRIYAEDPYRGFAPSTGRISGLRLPHAPFTRIDHAIREDYEVSPYYDPMLAKLIVWGRDRPQAISRLAALLNRVRIGGIHTSIPLGIDLCSWQDFRDGRFHTASLESWLESREHLPSEAPELLVQLAAVIARRIVATATSHQVAVEAVDFDAGEWGRVGRLEASRRL